MPAIVRLPMRHLFGSKRDDIVGGQRHAQEVTRHHHDDHQHGVRIACPVMTRPTPRKQHLHNFLVTEFSV
jgi:hypothetical protein